MRPLESPAREEHFRSGRPHNSLPATCQPGLDKYADKSRLIFTWSQNLKLTAHNMLMTFANTRARCWTLNSSVHDSVPHANSGYQCLSQAKTAWPGFQYMTCTNSNDCISNSGLLEWSKHLKAFLSWNLQPESRNQPRPYPQSFWQQSLFKVFPPGPKSQRRVKCPSSAILRQWLSVSGYLQGLRVGIILQFDLGSAGTLQVKQSSFWSHGCNWNNC